jgi:hypothetical protein
LAKAPDNGKAGVVTSTLDASLATPQERYKLLSTHAVGGFLAVARFWIPPSNDHTAGSWSVLVVTVIGTPTMTVDAVAVPRVTTWPASTNPTFSFQPGCVVAPAGSDDLFILAGSVATGTRIVPQQGHRSWADYHDHVPGHVWCFVGLATSTLGYASWSSGATVPTAWDPIVNEKETILASLPADAPFLEDDTALQVSSQLCMLPRVLPLPMYHGHPMGQIFSTDLSADGFVEALEAMATGLPNELGYVQHAWSHPERLKTNWVQQSDIQDSLVLPLDKALPTKPFSLPLFSLDYGLAYSLHRDCMILRMTKTVLKIFIL